MIHAQNERLVGDVSTAAVGATATATLTVDTLGYDVASFAVLRGNNASTVFANVLKVEESDSQSTGYTDVTGLVGGAASGFTMPTIAASATASAAVVKLDVDTKARKRYLRLAYTPGVSVTCSLSARLSRAENSPANASEVGSCVNGWVVR
jgi:hypothetical protein